MSVLEEGGEGGLVPDEARLLRSIPEIIRREVEELQNQTWRRALELYEGEGIVQSTTVMAYQQEDGEVEFFPASDCFAPVFVRGLLEILRKVGEIQVTVGKVFSVLQDINLMDSIATIGAMEASEELRNCDSGALAKLEQVVTVLTRDRRPFQDSDLFASMGAQFGTLIQHIITLKTDEE